MNDLITGDDTTCLVTLTDDDGVVVPIAGATLVQAVLADVDRCRVLVGPIVCVAGTDGADWAAGVVAVPIVGAVTALLKPQLVHWQVKVVLAGKTTSFRTAQPFTMAKGLIP